MLAQFVVDLRKDSTPRFGDECAGCGGQRTVRVALPVRRDAEREIELPSCQACRESHDRRRGLLVRSVLLVLVLLAGLCIAGAMFEEFDDGMRERDHAAGHHEGAPDAPMRLGLTWYAMSLGFGALFMVGSWYVRDREPTVSVTCLGVVDRYAFVDEHAGRRFAVLNEAHTT
jgi:hypothetical protein